VVSDFAEAHFNLRVRGHTETKHLLNAMEQIHARIAQSDGFRCEWSAGLNRPPKEAGPAWDLLFGAWQKSASLCGTSIQHRDTGGASDGNLLESAGLPIIDNLGILGDHIHSPREYCIPSSMTERTILVTCFLMQLAAGAFDEGLPQPFARLVKSIQAASAKSKST
jgi:glutamate carboxypeptidase